MERTAFLIGRVQNSGHAPVPCRSRAVLSSAPSGGNGQKRVRNGCVRCPYFFTTAREKTAAHTYPSPSPTFRPDHFHHPRFHASPTPFNPVLHQPAPVSLISPVLQRPSSFLSNDPFSKQMPILSEFSDYFIP